MAPIATTLSELIVRAKKRADMENSAFLADADWVALANEGQLELFDLLVRTHEDYFETTLSPNLSTVAGQEDYALPTDFYKLLGAEVQYTGSASTDEWRTLAPYHPQRRNAFAEPVWRGRLYRYVTHYRLVGENIRFRPVPQSVETIRLRYVALPDELELSAQEDLAHILLSHWSEHIVLHMAIEAMKMEESDTQALERRMASIQRKIERSAKDRDEGMTIQVADVRGHVASDDWAWFE